MNEPSEPLVATIESRPSRQLAAFAIALLSALFIASVLYNPAGRSVYAQYPTLCLFKILSGLPCPLCGLAHSFCAIAKGDFVASFSFNLLGPPLFLTLILIWIRSACVLLNKTRLALAFDAAAQRLKLIRLFAIAFAVFGAARIIYALVFHPE